MTISAVAERGSAISASSSTTVAGSPTANIVVDRYAFCLCVTDNTQTTDGASTDHTSVTDTDGHTWAKLYEHTIGRGVVAAGVTQSLWMTKVTTQIDTTDTITLTMGTARTAKVICFAECQITSGSTLQIAATGVASHQLVGQTVTTVSAVVSGLTSQPYLLIGALAVEAAAAAWTEDADYTNVMASEGVTNGGTAVTNVTAFWGTRIATLTGDTFAPAISASRDMVGSLVALEELAGGATGTVAVTQDAQTSTASAVETLTATSAQTQAAQTSTASGSVANPVSGTLAQTQADQNSTAAGAETITGTSAAAQANQTSTASALETFTGSSATTQADQASTAAAVVGDAPSATLAETQDDQTSTASGSVVVVISGSGAITQADQTSTSTAVETFAGTSVNVQADQTGAATGTLGISGTSTTTQDSQTSTASGLSVVAVTGTLAEIQDDQFATATANGGTVTFWVPYPVGYVFDPVAYVPDPAAYVKVGPDSIPPAW